MVSLKEGAVSPITQGPALEVDGGVACLNKLVIKQCFDDAGLFRRAQGPRWRSLSSWTSNLMLSRSSSWRCARRPPDALLRAVDSLGISKNSLRATGGWMPRTRSLGRRSRPAHLPRSILGSSLSKWALLAALMAMPHPRRRGSLMSHQMSLPRQSKKKLQEGGLE